MLAASRYSRRLVSAVKLAAAALAAATAAGAAPAFAGAGAGRGCGAPGGGGAPVRGLGVGGGPTFRLSVMQWGRGSTISGPGPAPLWWRCFGGDFACREDLNREPF